MSVVRRTGQQYQRHIRRPLQSGGMDLDLASDVKVLSCVASRLSRLEADSRTESEPHGARRGRKEC
jgi:hypothetical protein